jgi:hypothetical protein
MNTSSDGGRIINLPSIFGLILAPYLASMPRPSPRSRDTPGLDHEARNSNEMVAFLAPVRCIYGPEIRRPRTHSERRQPEFPPRSAYALVSGG